MKLPGFLKKYLIKGRKKKTGVDFPVYCKIRGTATADAQGALAQSRPEDELQIVHVPEMHKVFVYSIKINRLLGNLEENLGNKLVFIFGEGFCLDGEILSVTGGPTQKRKHFGCNIAIYDTTFLMRYADQI